MNKPQEKAIGDIITAVDERRSFLVATHVRPDGDAIGSLLALTFMLHKMGKRADAYCRDPIPPGHDFLPGSDMVRQETPQPSEFDAAILVDCGDFDRVGSALAESIRKIPFLINIDHHLNDTPFGTVDWVEPSASSTCEMLYDLSLAWALPLTPETATQLYTGILTDTGCFRFSNTNYRVLEVAAALVGAGAQPAFIAQQIYDSASPQRLSLLAHVLSTVIFADNDRLATAELTQEMFRKTGTSPVDSEGFINHLRSVKSVELAMLFREETDGIIHVSMRSKGYVNVASFAQQYDGGGHRHAAAFRVSGNLAAVRADFTRKALNYLG